LGIAEVIERYHSTRREYREKWENYVAAQQQMDESQSFERLLESAFTEQQLGG
jgi:hypothetical protein